MDKEPINHWHCIRCSNSLRLAHGNKFSFSSSAVGHVYVFHSHFHKLWSTSPYLWFVSAIPGKFASSVPLLEYICFGIGVLSVLAQPYFGASRIKGGVVIPTGPLLLLSVAEHYERLGDTLAFMRHNKLIVKHITGTFHTHILRSHSIYWFELTTSQRLASKGFSA